jgi:hypothetical protein
MNRTQQDYYNLLEETINYYSENISKRASTDDFASGCLYRTEDGRMCAVGRCLNQDLFDYEEFNTETPVVDISDYLEEWLLEEYQGFDIDFWADLQTLHDIKEHWENKGLSKLGAEYKDKIVRRIKEDYYITGNLFNSLDT